MILSLLVLVTIQLNSDSQGLNQYRRILETYVDNYGRVNYKALAQKESHQLSDIIRSMNENSPLNKPGAFIQKNDQLAYWMNMYNLIVLREVAIFYPIKSIQNIHDVWKRNTM
ncbi:MAG: hypothetical protein KDD94_14640 [Calditrichaeota bacterium]|nr:hypothetical protein [Calditrichota bacterium]